MQIKKRLQINVAVSMLMALVICLVFFLTLYRLNKANNLAKISGEIVSSVLERVTLRNDYIRNNITRAKEQWRAKHEQIGDLLKTASENFRSDEDRTNIAELIEDHESIGKIFAAIVANREKRTLRAGSAALSREVEDRLLSQLNMRVYEVVLHSRKLLQSNREARDSALRLAGWGIISVLVMLIVAALVNSRIMGRAITDRVHRLREGASAIGAGNLDYRIDVKGDDELTELSGAFNAMTAKLRRSYDDLNNEIELRKRIEEKLQTAHSELEKRVEERTAQLSQTTELAKAERQRFYDVLETLPAYVCLLTPDYQMPFANRVFREWFSYDPDKKCYEFLFDRTQPCENCETYAVLKTNAPQHWEWTGPNGRDYSIFDFPFIDTDGASFILEMGIDITEQKKAEVAMKLLNAYNRSLIEVSLDPLVTISAEGKITDVNAATEAATGCVRAELIDTDFSDYFTEPEKARAGYEQVFRTGSVRNYELELRHKDGRATPVLYNASVYRDEQGNVLGVFAAARDITEQKQAQKELRDMNEQLEQRIFERTAELHAANETLRASRVAALNLMEDALQARRGTEKLNSELTTVNRDLEAFIYSVSHDLRAPLRHIAGFSRILAEDYGDGLDKEAKEYLDRIHNGAEKMSHLIEDMLHLSRVSRQEMKREQIDLNAMVSALVNDLREANLGDTREVVVQEHVSASADHRLIKLALQNLLDNAWKFTSKTQNARIEFDACEQNGEVVYRVSDNGAGFDPTYAGKMFLPFHRLHAESEFEGTGIGLAIVERVIRRHGGTVWAEGTVGKGATVYFTLGRQTSLL